GARISNAYSAGASRFLVSAPSGGSLANVYYDADTTGIIGGAGTGLSTDQLQQALPDGFDPTVWGIVEGTSYPYLLRQFARGATPEVVSGVVTDSGAGVEVQG